MFNINDLRSLSGSKVNRSSESLGLGSEYADESWKETYKKIVNSKESAAFHIMAAESAFGYDVVLQFSIENLVHNLSIESAVIDIIEPLRKSNSTEANNIYYKLVERMSLEAKGEGFGSKVKEVAGKVWTAIKEAFKKLRLAFTHMIAGIKRFIVMTANSGDAKNVYQKKAEVMKNLVDKKVADKTIKVLAYSSTKLVNVKNEANLDKITTFISNNLTSFQKEINDQLNARTSNTSDTRSKMERLKAKWDDAIDQSFKKGGIEGMKGIVAGGKNVPSMKQALYGNKPSAKSIKIGNIITSEKKLDCLAPNWITAQKAAMGAMDNNIKSMNMTIAQIEKFEKSFNTDDKAGKRETLEQLQFLRTIISKLGQIMKDHTAETFRLRGVYLKAAKAALGGASMSEKEYKKDQKAKDKQWKEDEEKRRQEELEKQAKKVSKRY